MDLMKWFKSTATESQDEKGMVIEKELADQIFSIKFDDYEIGRIVFVGGGWFFHTRNFLPSGSADEKTHLFTVDEMDTISIELSRLSQKYPEGIKC